MSTQESRNRMTNKLIWSLWAWTLVAVIMVFGHLIKQTYESTINLEKRVHEMNVSHIQTKILLQETTVALGETKDTVWEMKALIDEGNTQREEMAKRIVELGESPSRGGITREKAPVPTPNVPKTPINVGTEGKTFTMNASAYGATKLNGGAGTGVTSLGKKPVGGQTVAVDPKLIPLGTKLRITCESYPSINGIYIAEDKGGAIKGKKIDIYFDDWDRDPYVARKEMLAFGRRTVVVTIIND